MSVDTALSIVSGEARGSVIFTPEPLSFWGGVSPDTARVIDVHHPLHGVCLTGSILLMPTSRGSCSGSGVLLDLILNERAPAAIIFTEKEDVLTLGAIVAQEMFGKQFPVLRVAVDVFDRLAAAHAITIRGAELAADGVRMPLNLAGSHELELDDADEAALHGAEGAAVQTAMRIICAMARQQGATRLTDVTRTHIDGCIYASPANLRFAQGMLELGAKVRIPTTMNAISVDFDHWQAQGVPAEIGMPSAQLAQAYVTMGCRPTFTCSPYQLADPPVLAEPIAWAESNAVVYANSVLGARTPKHPDFLDLCIAVTGQAPLADVYVDENRRARRVVRCQVPEQIDELFWPLVGYLAGKLSPDRIPTLMGLEDLSPSPDDLKALCAAFGTTSAAPMLHIRGVTPEAALPLSPGADGVEISIAQLLETRRELSAGSDEVDLVAIGSPHASLADCRALADALEGHTCDPDVVVIVTAGRDVIALGEEEGTLGRLTRAGVLVLRDMCWCTISEPVFPPDAKAVMTNSVKYAHYGPGLSGRSVRLGSLEECAKAAVGRRSPQR